MGILYPDWRNSGGSSGFTKANDDLRPFFSNHNGLNAIPLGINRLGGKTGAIWHTTHLQGHGLCIAPNASGKSAGTAIPAAINHGGSMLIVCVKGELTAITAARRLAMGQRVVILDPFGEVARRYGCCPIRPTRFNPLSFINPRSENFADDVDAIADASVITHPGENPHWPDSAREFDKGCIALAKELYGPNATLRHVRRFMTGSVEEILRSIAKAKLMFPDSLAERKLRRFTADTDEIQSVRSTALTQTAFLDNDQLAAAMTNDDPIFNLEEFTARPTTIYIVLPPDKLVTYGRWLRIIIALTLRAIVRADVPPAIPSMLLIDEMGVLGPLRCLEAAYGLLRSYSVRVFGFYQSLSQMKNDYPQTWQHLVNNCSVLQLLGARDQETAAYFSELLGTTTLREDHPSYFGRIANENIPSFARRTIGSRPIMYPHELTTLLGNDPTMKSNTQLIIYPQGGHKVLTLQNPYFLEPRWKGMYRDPSSFWTARSNGGGELYRRLFGN